MIGTGESSIRSPLTKKEYFAECSPEVTASYICGYYGIAEPSLVQQRSSNGIWEGGYCCRTELIDYTHPYTGIILHELAHHVNYKLYCRAGHCREFGQILQEIIELWR